MNNWSVTTTTYPNERKWGIRGEWIGLGYVLAIQVNASPALRVILLGWSFYVGKLLPPPKTVAHELVEIAASKGWVHQAYPKNTEKRGDSNTTGGTE